MKRRIPKKAKSGNRELILQKALGLFARYGYNGTTIRDICKEADLSVSAIHYHWDSKEHLWQDVCKLTAQQVMDVFTNAADFTKGPQEAMPEFLGNAFEALAARPELMRIVMWFTLEAEQFDYGSTRDFFEPLVEFGLPYLKKNHPDRNMPEIELELALEAVRNQAIYLIVDRPALVHSFGKDLSDPEHAERVKSFFVKTSMLTLGLASGENGELIPTGARRARRVRDKAGTTV